MIDERRQKFRPYIQKLMDLFHLKDWEFKISDDGPSDIEALASICCVHGRRFCTFFLSNDFLDETKEKRRWIILHEITHCHFSIAQHHINANADHNISRIYDQLHEYGIDAVAIAIASFFPLEEE
jgi:hypothetical protein